MLIVACIQIASVGRKNRAILSLEKPTSKKFAMSISRSTCTHSFIMRFPLIETFTLSYNTYLGKGRSFFFQTQLWLIFTQDYVLQPSETNLAKFYRTKIANGIRATKL
eukprot:TRINITY_DN5790_c0_g1_i4.p2 TRINITY_DN5790_c0_g1~~TRINITY_DN5790_c0_g1_i4.p2  ORF type:complete len:108 (+),score=13.49 TRINITY_DN5790_c0_g1_i4:367-690(+)